MTIKSSFLCCGRVCTTSTLFGLDRQFRRKTMVEFIGLPLWKEKYWSTVAGMLRGPINGLIYMVLLLWYSIGSHRDTIPVVLNEQDNGVSRSFIDVNYQSDWLLEIVKKIRTSLIGCNKKKIIITRITHANNIAPIENAASTPTYIQFFIIKISIIIDRAAHLATRFVRSIF